MVKELMKDTSDPDYDEYTRELEQFEAEYGEDWDGTMIEYDNDFVSFPTYVGRALTNGNIRTVLQWLGKGNVKERVNAQCQEGGSASLLLTAAVNQQHDLMSYFLLNGADVNIVQSHGASVLTVVCSKTYDDQSKAIWLLLSWGAEPRCTNEQGREAEIL